MFSVTFGELNSYDDLGLILAHKTISEPAIKTAYVSVPGGNGALDYTDYFGDPTFEDRTISLEFLSLESWTDQMLSDSTVKNALHGRKMEIRCSDDPGWYWIGRISVGAWQYDRGAGKLPITIQAEPFKLAEAEKTLSRTFSLAYRITLSNAGRKPVVPTLDNTVAVRLTITESDGSTTLISYQPGEGQVVDDLILFPGDTTLTVTNIPQEEGTFTFHWREGSL